MTDEQRSLLQRRLESELADAEREIEQLDEQIQSFGVDSGMAEPAMNHPGDAADSVYERERLMTIRDDLSRRLQEIRDALDKFSSERYGECERCGELIPIERLEALPFARHCITCQEHVEQGGVA